MTIEIEDAALARFLDGPAPYGSGAPAPAADAPRQRYLTAEQELAAALEGQAPRMAHDVSELLGPERTARLAQVVRRAVAVGIKRRADQETADRLTGVYDLLAEGLNQITDGCTTPEVQAECACAVLNDNGDCTACGQHWESVSKPCDHSESLYGRCVACGMTWEQQAAEADRG